MRGQSWGQAPGSAQGRARLISGPDLDKGITGLAGISLNPALRRDDAELDWVPPDLNYATQLTDKAFGKLSPGECLSSEVLNFKDAIAMPGMSADRSVCAPKKGGKVKGLKGIHP